MRNGQLPASNQDTYAHDDGMGGAGASGDGRNFNYDNDGSNPHIGQANDLNSLLSQLMGASIQSASRGNSNTGQATGIVTGGPGGLLQFLMGTGGGGSSLNLGDFALGDSNLEDIIARIFEQTAGQNATPRASDEEIAKLERIRKNDVEKISSKKNVDCPICLDVFLDPETRCDVSKSNLNWKSQGGENSTSFPSPWSSSSISGPTLPNPTNLSDEMDIDEPQDYLADHEDPPEELPKLAGKQKEEEGDSDRLAALPCLHLFHEDCLVPWLQNNGSCPVCRYKMKSAEEAQTQRQESRQQSTQQTPGNGEEGQNRPTGPATLNLSSLLSSLANSQRSNSSQPQAQAQPQLQPQASIPNSTSTPSIPTPTGEVEDSEDVRRERMRRRIRRAAENRASGAPVEDGNSSAEEGANRGPPGGYEGGEFDLD